MLMIDDDDDDDDGYLRTSALVIMILYCVVVSGAKRATIAGLCFRTDSKLVFCVCCYFTL